MKAKNLNQLAPLYFFTKESLRQLEKDENALNFNLKYWLKKGIIIQLKRGVYSLKEKYDQERNKNLYLEYLANKLYEPSYLSLEYVMNKYSLLTEAVYNFTSVTLKSTKSLTNKLGTFRYYSLSPVLFFGFEINKFNSAPILIAQKPKAVFDFLYLRFLKKVPINIKAIVELRINWENISKSEFQKIVKYSQMAKSVRLREAIGLIKKTYYA